jgi:hypothetical protein
MLIGLSRWQKEAGYSAVTTGVYSPVGLPENIRRPLRSGNDLSGRAETSGVFEILETWPNSSLWEWAYYADVRGMIDGGLTEIQFFFPSSLPVYTIKSVNLQSGSPQLNQQNDMLISKGIKEINIISGASNTGSAAGSIFRWTPGVSPLEPDPTFCLGGRWLNRLGQCAVIDGSSFDITEGTVTIQFRGMTKTEAAELVGPLMQTAHAMPVVVWDSEGLFGDDFLFRAVQLTEVSPTISAGDVYSLRLRGRIL